MDEFKLQEIEHSKQFALPNGQESPRPMPSLRYEKAIEQGLLHPTAIGNGGCKTEQVVDPKKFPYCAVGRLRVEFSTGLSFGTGFVVSDKVLMTAGHCIYWRGSYPKSAHVEFNVSGRTIPLRVAVTHVGHHARFQGNEATLDFDFGFCVLDRGISAMTGMIGYEASGGVIRKPIQSIGFPAVRSPKYSFDGTKLWQSTGFEMQKAPRFHVRPAQSELTQGASGGPWLTDFGDGPVAVGLNSFTTIPARGVMNSPIFDEDFLDLLDEIDSKV